MYARFSARSDARLDERFDARFIVQLPRRLGGPHQRTIARHAPT